ncbi:hypothetical protein HCU40_16645 [Pseudanabaena biceps]|nr:hypothetical protein [Pseudanabaena biceps]
MSNVLPSEAIAKEIFELELNPKALLLNELTDSVLQPQEGLKNLNLSADATQWTKSLTTIETLTIIQALAHSLQAELIRNSEEQKLEDPQDQFSFAEFRAEQGHQTCPCGDMDVYSCAGECGFLDTAIFGVIPQPLTGVDLDNFDY